MRKISLLTTLALTAFTPLVSAEKLNDNEREKLKQRLETLIEKSKESASKRHSKAYKAFKSGSASNSAALNLYLKCVEKVNYTEAGKQQSAFREWKRRNKEKHTNNSFRLALRHQLNWLLLSLEVSRQKEINLKAVSPKAQSALAQIFSDADKLEGQQNVLKQNALNSVFAKAYGINKLKLEGWPDQPLNISAIYEQVVLPPLRSRKDEKAIRSAWEQRLELEEKAVELWTTTDRNATAAEKRDTASEALLKFTSETRLSLLWAMEKDIFTHANQSAAANNMLETISQHFSHKKSLDWANELKNLLEEKPKEKKEKPE